MREQGLAEDTPEVYGTLTDYRRRHNEGAANGLDVAYIRLLASRTDFTYFLVSGYIPRFCTERRPW